MTLNQLNYYVEIVRQGSFTKAAEKLFVSQPTLSKAIRALEEEFQMELINRGAKEFQLTPQGNVFNEYAVKILDFYHTQTQELFQRLHSADGTLKLGIPPTAGAIFFFSILYQFRSKYPGIDLQDKCWILLAKYNLKMLILTCGVNGSYVFTPGEISFVETPKVEVADTVGAGDSFTATFVAAILKGKPVAEAHKLAVEVSAYVCTQNGAMPELPARLKNELI